MITALQLENFTAFTTIQELENLGWDFSSDREAMDEAGIISTEEQDELVVRITARNGVTWANIEPEGHSEKTGADEQTKQDIITLSNNSGLIEFIPTID